MSKNLKHDIGQHMRFWYYFHIHKVTIESVSSIRYKLAFLPIEDSDQPVYQHSLIRAFDGHSMGNQGSIIFSGGKLIRQCVDAQTDLDFLLFAHANMYLLLGTSSFNKHAQLSSGSTLLILVQAFVIFLLGVCKKQRL